MMLHRNRILGLIAVVLTIPTTHVMVQRTLASRTQCVERGILSSTPGDNSALFVTTNSHTCDVRMAMGGKTESGSRPLPPTIIAGSDHGTAIVKGGKLFFAPESGVAGSGAIRLTVRQDEEGPSVAYIAFSLADRDPGSSNAARR